MRFRRLEKWNLNQELNGLLFFAQRSEELLFDYTLDSYKTSSLNAPFLCEEALNLVEAIKSELIDQSNLTPVLEELKWSIRNDKIAKSLLDLPYEKYILDPKTTSLDELKIKLSVLRRTLDTYRYLARCNEFLSTAVVNGEKKNIDLYAKSLFTTLINTGLNKSYLYKQVIDFFYTGKKPKKIDDSSLINAFLESIYPKSHDFDVYFWVSGLINKVAESTRAFRIDILDDLPSAVKELLDEEDLPSKSGLKVVKVGDLRASDSFSAREYAESNLGRLRDLYNLYHHKTKIEWEEQAVITQCCAERPSILRVQRRAVEKIEDERPDQASRKLNRLLRYLSLSGDSFEKFNRAVDFHSLSVHSLDTENQLLNLWIGLETISPTHSGQAKISQIISGVLPFLSILYTKRLFGRITRDLLKWNRRATIKIVKNIPDSKGIALIDKVTLLILDPSLQKLRDELYSELRDFHLLRYRLFNLSEVFATPQKTLDLLDSHEEKVSWQIRRIYRSRNLLVHSGQSLPYLPSLVENAHDYFDQVIYIFIRMCTGPYRVRSIEQAFELAKITRQSLRNSLKEIDSFKRDNILFLTNDYGFLD